MKERLGIILGFGVVVSVIAVLALFMAGPGSPDSIEYIFMALVVCLSIFSSFIVIKRAKDLKSGLPVEDELSRKVSHKAGAHAWISSIWIAVALVWYNTFFVDNFNVPELATEQALGAVILSSGMIFFVLAFYYNRRGEKI
ncbi:MAG: hypothetical protein SVJ22_09735 [Halobacteriota archaeon]|nr:hypothetical protein [Halobacteriota archaeon]